MAELSAMSAMDGPPPRFKPTAARLALAIGRTAYPKDDEDQVDTFYTEDVRILREELLRLRPDITEVRAQ